MLFNLYLLFSYCPYPYSTNAKSNLFYETLILDKIIDKNGSDLQEGDLIPVCEGLELNDTFNIITHLDVKKYLLPTEYIYKAYRESSNYENEILDNDNFVNEDDPNKVTGIPSIVHL